MTAVDTGAAAMTPAEVVARAMFAHFFGGTSDPTLTDMAEGMATSLADQALAALRDAGFVVLTEAEVAAREAAAAMQEREACAEVVRDAPPYCLTPNGGELFFPSQPQLAAAIRARPAPPGADALAAMVAQARKEGRREGIEAAARWCETARDGAELPPDKGMQCNLESAHAMDDAAAAIRALLDAQPDEELARDFAAWTEGESDG